VIYFAGRARRRAGRTSDVRGCPGSTDQMLVRARQVGLARPAVVGANAAAPPVRLRAAFAAHGGLL
jgi:hypothetical protein